MSRSYTYAIFGNCAENNCSAGSTFPVLSDNKKFFPLNEPDYSQVYTRGYKHGEKSELVMEQTKPATAKSGSCCGRN